jgi:membrane-associated phospholipid phosphatase
VLTTLLSCKRLTLAVAAMALALPAPAQADERSWATASDVAVGGLVAWSVGGPLVNGDEKGALQAGLSIAAAQGATQLLKRLINKPRPDRSDNRSFPSGHTATAFAAASSIMERRGADEGLPALAAAGFVGTARVRARKHDWPDVAAGAAIGTASGVLVTRPRQERISLAAWGTASGGGLAFSMSF